MYYSIFIYMVSVWFQMRFVEQLWWDDTNFFWQYVVGRWHHKLAIVFWVLWHTCQFWLVKSTCKPRRIWDLYEFAQEWTSQSNDSPWRIAMGMTHLHTRPTLKYLKWNTFEDWRTRRTNIRISVILFEPYPLVNKHSYWKWLFIVDLPIKNGDFL